MAGVGCRRQYKPVSSWNSFKQSTISHIPFLSAETVNEDRETGRGVFLLEEQREKLLSEPMNEKSADSLAYLAS